MTDNNRLKFRVWDEDNKKYMSHHDELCITQSGLFAIYDRPVLTLCSPFAERLVIEQCTGFSDKNGKLIYEGDIIKSPNNKYWLQICRMPSGLWGCKECRLNGVWEMDLYNLIRNYKIEIISNIHN